MSPLNYNLRFVTASGVIDHAAIDADIPRRAAEMARRYDESRASFGRYDFSPDDWIAAAKRDLYAQADGEMALYEVRAHRAAAAAPVLMAAE